MEVSIVFISLFIVVFGIFYMHYTTRHKERLALIEKDKDVSLFYSAKPARAASQVWKIIILNLGLLLVGVGLGVVLAYVLTSFTPMADEPAIVASIFFMAGVGLLVGFAITKKMEKATV